MLDFNAGACRIPDAFEPDISEGMGMTVCVSGKQNDSRECKRFNN